MGIEDPNHEGAGEAEAGRAGLYRFDPGAERGADDDLDLLRGILKDTGPIRGQQEEKFHEDLLCDCGMHGSSCAYRDAGRRPGFEAAGFKAGRTRRPRPLLRQYTAGTSRQDRSQMLADCKRMSTDSKFAEVPGTDSHTMDQRS